MTLHVSCAPTEQRPHVPQLGAMVLQGHPKHSLRGKQAGRWGKEGWRCRVRESDPSKKMGVRINGGAGRKCHKRVVKEEEMLELKAELEKFTGIAVQQDCHLANMEIRC